MERTKPTGRVVGIDLIPAQPPRGVSTIQGNFLSPAVQATVKQFLAEEALRPLPDDDADANADDGGSPEPPQSYIDAGRQPSPPGDGGGRTVDVRAVSPPSQHTASSSSAARSADTRWRAHACAHAHAQQQVVLSDMSAPWPQTSGFAINTLSNPYRRMMNTSGTPFRDHAGSMVSSCITG